MTQNTMVPYESIDPTGAGTLRPGVSFFVSNKTIAELIAEKGLFPSPDLMAAEAGSRNGRKISEAEAKHICALVDGETTPADIELALAALETVYGVQVWDTYHRIRAVLINQRPPDISPGFAALLAARLDKEAANSKPLSVTGAAVVFPPPSERTRES